MQRTLRQSVVQPGGSCRASPALPGTLCAPSKDSEEVPLCSREGGTLNCAPSADAVAGNGGTLNCAPSADAVAGNGGTLNCAPSADAVAGNTGSGRAC